LSKQSSYFCLAELGVIYLLFEIDQNWIYRLLIRVGPSSGSCSRSWGGGGSFAGTAGLVYLFGIPAVLATLRGSADSN
jgi:Kef-type K+ transport system membrane component KefB